MHKNAPSSRSQAISSCSEHDEIPHLEQALAAGLGGRFQPATGWKQGGECQRIRVRWPVCCSPRRKGSYMNYYISLAHCTNLSRWGSPETFPQASEGENRKKKKKRQLLQKPTSEYLILLHFNLFFRNFFSINTGLGVEQYVHRAYFPRVWRPPCSIHKPRKTQTKKVITSKGLLSIICPSCQGETCVEKNPGMQTVSWHLPKRVWGELIRFCWARIWLSTQVGIHEILSHSLHSNDCGLLCFCWHKILISSNSPN